MSDAIATAEHPPRCLRCGEVLGKGPSLGECKQCGLQYDFGAFDAGLDYAYRDLGRLTQNHLFSVNVGL